MPSRGDKNRPSGRIHPYQRNTDDAVPIIGGGNTITAEHVTAIQRGGLLFAATEIRGEIFDALGGGKAGPISDRAVHFYGSARPHSIKTPQSTSVRLGWG